jgi:WD40 repeat protein
VLNLHATQVNDLVVSPNGTWAATADDRGQVVVWQVDQGSGLWTYRESLVGHDGAVTGLAVDPGGHTLVTVSRDGTSISWDLSPEAGFGTPVPGLGDRWISNRPQSVVPGRLMVAPTRPAPTSARPFSDQVAVTAVFLNPRTGRVVDRVPIGNTKPGLTFGSSVSVSSDGTKSAVTYGRGTVVLDNRTRDELARIVLDDVNYGDGPEPEPVWSSVWSPDGDRLLLAAGGSGLPGDVAEHGSLVAVDTTTWRPEADRIDVGGAPQTMEVSPDGRSLAAGLTIPSVNHAPPGSVRILDAHTLELRRVLHLGEEDFPFDLSFSPDGRRLAVGSDQGTVFVFDLDSGALLHEPAHVNSGFVQQVEWMPDSTTLVTSGSDGTVSLYDSERGIVRAHLPASSDSAPTYTYVSQVTTDEITTFAGERPGRTYSLNIARWLDYACVVASRNLTKDEWSSYLPDRPYRRVCHIHS